MASGTIYGVDVNERKMEIDKIQEHKVILNSIRSSKLKSPYLIKFGIYCRS